MKLTVDSTALDQARSDLGLVLDVRVIFERLQPTRKEHDACHGRYTGIDPFHSWHNCWVHKWITVEAANAALWHELTHALQCERTGSYAVWQSAYFGYDRSIGYAANPFEVEAFAATAMAREGALGMLLYDAEA